MRMAPAFAAASNTRLDPSTFSSRVASLALRIANARSTTTSAPFTRLRTLAASVTSPWRYSVFFQPCSSGSNGRRAIPMMRCTARERSSAFTIAIPRSPVGPVTASVSRSLAMYGVLSDWARDVLAAAEQVDPVGHNRVDAGAAAHAIPPAVSGLDAIVSRARGERVAARPAGHVVVADPRPDPVVPAATLHGGGPAGGADGVVAARTEDRDAGAVREHRVVVGACIHEVLTAAGVDPILAIAAEKL